MLKTLKPEFVIDIPCMWFMQGRHAELHSANIYTNKRTQKLVNKYTLRYFELKYGIEASFLVIPTLTDF